VRIIAGQFRGRALASVGKGDAGAHLRPTTDRVRESLFSVLTHLNVINGARCLDLFAGTGVLGFESLSRGADAVTLVERDARVAAQLRASAGLLAAAGAEIHHRDALTFLNEPARPFEVVFLDPPFRQGLLRPAIERLHGGGWLAADAAVYIEVEHESPCPPLPAGWRALREGQAGQVRYFLVTN